MFDNNTSIPNLYRWNQHKYCTRISESTTRKRELAMKYAYRIIYNNTGKPFKIASGVYEIPAEEVVLNSFEEAENFIKARQGLTYELVLDKIEPEPFDPETANMFIERPAHTMKVGDLIRREFEGEYPIAEVVKIGEVENNVFKVVFHDSTIDYFAINQKLLFHEEFEVHYKLTYTKKVVSPDLSKLNDVKITKWSPSKEIHDRRLADLKTEKNWKVSNVKESRYFITKIYEVNEPSNKL